MVMTEEQGMTLLSRVSSGEGAKDVWEDLGISKSDFIEWRSEHATELRNAKRKGSAPVISSKERRLSEFNRSKEVLQRRLARIDSDIARVEAE